MKRLIVIAALAILAQGAAANDVLYCTEEEGALLKPTKSGFEMLGKTPERFKLAFDGMSARIGGSSLEGEYSCHSPFSHKTYMLDCKGDGFKGFSYNTKTGYGVSHYYYSDDNFPTSGDTPGMAIFKCDAF